MTNTCASQYASPSVLLVDEDEGKRRQRTLSLSLRAPEAPRIFDKLPIELITLILEHSIAGSSASILPLSCVCKGLNILVDAIIYHTVIIDSPRKIALFHNATTGKTSTFLADHVKTLVITWSPRFGIADQELIVKLCDILRRCTGVAKLVLPTIRPRCSSDPAPLLQNTTEMENVQELVLENYHENLIMPPSIRDTPGPQCPPNIADSITHLRICQPSEVWFAPCYILRALGKFPKLTHLHLARRSGANQENDLLFARDIKTILESWPQLKQIIVSVFAQPWCASLEAAASDEMHLVCLLHELRLGDTRLSVRRGIYNHWQHEWDDRASVVRRDGPMNFWTYGLDLGCELP